jgi:hypothetical protein
MSDIHQLEAFRACSGMFAAGHCRMAFLGDFVGYGADPAWVVDTVRTG